MFNLFKSKSDKITEKEKLIDKNIYDLVECEDGTWLTKEFFCGSWLVIPYEFKDKLGAIESILSSQADRLKRERILKKASSV